jgi:transcriptional regulator of PTS gene
VLAPAPDRLLAISIYVDSRELRAVLVNLQESVLAEEARALGVEAGNRQLGDAIRTLARSLSGRVPARSTLVGASLSLVGTVNPRTRTWVSAARWPKLRGLDLSGLESRIGFPIVLRRTNDVELAYFLECNPHLAAVNALLLHWGFGIGSAVSFRGIPLSSSLGRFGEIGHSRVGSGGDAPCLCGSRGCLEATAALWALHPLLQRRLGRLPEDERALGPLLGSRGLLELPELRQALQGVQAALHTLYLIFYPDVILLSGPFPENGAVFGELARGFTRSLPDYAKGAVKLAAIPGGMGGCRLGGASPLFRDSLRRALRRKP